MMDRSGSSARCSKPLLFLFSALLGLAAPAVAQQRTQPDSLRQDSLRRAKGDSLHVVADSVQPPPILAKHATGFPVDYGASVWEWTRDQLLLSHAITLGELMREIPSIAAMRTGLFLQPDLIAPFGETRGAVQVLLDGYELDPLTEASVDFARIELANLNHVRVERRLDVTRIELESLEPTEGRPHSRIDAGVGEPNVNLFRGIFLTPKFIMGPFGFTIERVDTDGLHRREPADVFAGWAKWAYIHGESGVQVEFRQSTFNRDNDSPFVGDGKRQDIVLRARAPIAPGLVAEVFGGHSKLDIDTVRARVTGDTIVHPRIESDEFQWGGRASFQSPIFWADGTLRMRSQSFFPPMQVDGNAGLRIPKVAWVTGAVSQANWGDAGNALSFDMRAQTDSVFGLHGFAELAGGTRGAPSAHFLTVDSAIVFSRKGLRAGLGFQRWGASATAGLIKLKSDSIQSFGLAFDSTDLVFGNSDVTGWEASWSVPLLVPWIRTTGAYTNYFKGNFSIYQPSQLWHTALELHAIPMKSKSLELYGWVELRHRGEMLAPALASDSTGFTTVTLPSQGVVNAYLQIRVMDVRLFIRGENLTAQQVEVLPGRIVATPRYLYGIKWTFTN